MHRSPIISAVADSTVAPEGAGLETSSCVSVGDYEVVIFRDPQKLACISADWTNLARCAAEPNPFYEPWMFLPAARMAVGERWEIATVWTPEASGRKRELVAFFPFVEKRCGFGWRWRCLSLLHHKYCFLTTPLLARGHECCSFGVLIEYMKRHAGPGLLELPLVNADGPLQRALVDVTRERLLTVYYIDQHNRGLLKRSDENAESYLHRGLGRKLREVRRQRRRMDEQGQVEVRSMFPHQASLWTEWFLELEAKGWKGKRGTAIVGDEREAEFFRGMVAGGAEVGKADMLGLFLNGEPIALKCNLRSGHGSFAFKIAYDESLAKFSPGTQLEVEMIRRFWGSPEVEWMDSCASPSHFMINRLWLDRRPMQHVVISTGRPVCDVLLASAPLARSLWRIGGRLRRRLISIVFGRNQRPAKGSEMALSSREARTTKNSGEVQR